MLDVVLSPLQEELDRYFAAARLRASDYGEHYVELWDRLEQASAGGKRARPALVLTAHRHLGGSDERAAVQLALAFELLHTAFLIHDDVIDHDDTRRGVPTLIGAFTERGVSAGVDRGSSQNWGEAAALLAGDLALSHAHRLVAQVRTDAETRDQLLDILDRAVFISAAGELSDVTNSATRGSLPVSDVLATLERKTAVYSCEAPLQAGAVLAGAGEEDVATLGRYGRLVGVAFQLTDDILGVFGEEATTGKSAHADLREGKHTTLIAHAATTDAWPDIAPHIGDPELTAERAAVVRERLRECGALDDTLRLARGHAELAKAELSASALPPALTAQLAVFADRAVERVR
ncbi:polyprenyl synthetase family protein [Glaciibacter flavus]|uniref:polyprenyl synthetase family protein n=1 Tax=Orlajensenia flava TaxID=2565934 RepID=UPI003AFFE221